MNSIHTHKMLKALHTGAHHMLDMAPQHGEMISQELGLNLTEVLSLQMVKGTKANWRTSGKKGGLTST
jgi:hypothetical protein